MIDNCLFYFLLNEINFTREEILLFLEEWSLNNNKDIRVSKLSSGQRQALSIGLSIISNPKLLILDEPMNHLDPLMRRYVREKIITLRDKGIKVILITHDLAEVDKITDDVAFINKGKLLKYGHLQTLMQDAKVTNIEELYEIVMKGDKY